MRIFASYSTSNLLKILLYSILRYIIFTSQYVLLILMFKVPVNVGTSFVLVSIVFLITAAIPTVALSELGVRGSVAIFVFGLWFQHQGVAESEYTALVVTASALIWLVNIVLPAIIGSFFLFRLKFIRTND